MSPHYSVYTVLQASRRSWRIGQTRLAKVYYFAYEVTIQTDALYLVAAKVAAALRVNGDTVADDSLAELDEITGNDIVTTLARIVTGETQLEAPNLQQAFAEANASIRQANTIIGEYELVDGAVTSELAAEPAGEPTLALQLPSQRGLLDELHPAGSIGATLLPLVTAIWPVAQVNGKVSGAGSPALIKRALEEKDEDSKTDAPPVPASHYSQSLTPA